MEISSKTIQEESGGNTKDPRAYSQLYNWCFTLKADKCTIQQLHSLLKGHCKKFTFSYEEGKTGFKHYQGCFSLIRKESFKVLKNMMFREMHLEPTKDVIAAESYCMKDLTHISGPYTESYVFVEVLTTLYAWQREVLDICLSKKKDDRTIYWYFDEIGNKGKTAFCKYMAYNHGATVLSLGSTADIACSLPDQPEIVLFNIPRGTPFKNYGALEQIKDGMIFSAKYASKMKLFNSPVVIVFSNQRPNEEKLSKDRWMIVDLGLAPQSSAGFASLDCTSLVRRPRRASC